MNRSSLPSRAPARVLVVFVAAVSVAACGSTPPSQPVVAQSAVPPTAASAAPSATPVPSASAVAYPAVSPSRSADPVAALVSTLSTSTWSSHATVSGTLALGSKSYPVSGFLDVAGADSHEARTVKLAGAGLGEWLTSGGRRYTRTSAGLWFAANEVDASADLWKFLRAARSFTDLGPATEPGTTGEHFRLTDAGIGPTALGLAGLKVASPTATVDVYAGTDGVPTRIGATAAWTSTASGRSTKVKVALTYAFDPSAPHVVAAPAEVWAMSTSKLFKYRIGHPVAWTPDLSTKAKFVDQFESDEYLYATGARDRTHGLGLSTIATYFKTHSSLKGWTQVKFVSMKSLTIDGAQARAVTTRAVEGSDKLAVITYLTIRSGWLYSINVIDVRGHEKADAGFGSKLVTTFRFP